MNAPRSDTPWPPQRWQVDLETGLDISKVRSTTPWLPRHWQRMGCLAALMAGVAVLVTSPCWGVPLFCLSLPAILEWSDRVPFDADAWKATDDTEKRYHMSWDLIHGSILKGKTPSEVKDLLGEPMMKDIFKSDRALPMFDSPHVKRGVETWYYSLGGELYNPGLGPSGAVLAVDFRNGAVFDVRKVVH
jgi:hypothetical protein